MTSFEWPPSCVAPVGPNGCEPCGQPGRKIRHGVWAHAYTNPNASGPSSHAFLADVVFERADEELKDRRWFERTHRDEMRIHPAHEREGMQR